MKHLSTRKNIHFLTGKERFCIYHFTENFTIVLTFVLVNCSKIIVFLFLLPTDFSLAVEGDCTKFDNMNNFGSLFISNLDHKSLDMVSITYNT